MTSAPRRNRAVYCKGSDGLVHYRHVSPHALCWGRVIVIDGTLTRSPTVLTCFGCVVDPGRRW